jgi:hypothetical protein
LAEELTAQFRVDRDLDDAEDSGREPGEHSVGGRREHRDEAVAPAQAKAGQPRRPAQHLRPCLAVGQAAASDLLQERPPRVLLRPPGDPAGQDQGRVERDLARVVVGPRDVAVRGSVVDQRHAVNHMVHPFPRADGTSVAFSRLLI